MKYKVCCSSIPFYGMKNNYVKVGSANVPSFYQRQCFCENNTASLKGLGHEVEFKYVDRNEQFYR